MAKVFINGFLYDSHGKNSTSLFTLDPILKIINASRVICMVKIQKLKYIVNLYIMVTNLTILFTLDPILHIINASRAVRHVLNWGVSLIPSWQRSRPDNEDNQSDE